MPDILFFVFGILGTLLPVALIGLIVYGIVVWRRRASEQARDDDDDDPGIGTVRRLYFYVVAFVSLMMWATGVVLILQFVLDAVFGDAVIADSTTRLAAGVSLIVVGAPLWFLHWRYVQRAVVEQPVEARSVLRKLYIYITLAVAGSIIIYAVLNVLNWIFRADDFSGYDLAATVIWGVVWAFHWRIEEGEGQATPEIRAIRRLYIYIAALAGLVMLSLGVGRVLYFVLLAGYDALTATPLLGGDSGLWRDAMREMLAVAIVGAGIWTLHWLYMARRDYESVLRQVYLYIFAILGGVMTTLVALGIIIHEFLTWALGTYGADTVAQHFEFVPGSVATLAVGAALWAYHWHRVRHEASESGGATLSARRAYTYILAAIGTGALAVAVFMLVSAAVKLVLAQFGDVVVGGDQWKRPLINIITLAVMGAPVWGYYWRDIQRRVVDIEADEMGATSRRIFLFAMLGVGVLALLGSVSALLFMFLRDLLDAALSLDTLNDMSAPIAVVAAAAAFLPYYWAVYRDDQDAVPEVVPETVEGQHAVSVSGSTGSPRTGIEAGVPRMGIGTDSPRTGIGAGVPRTGVGADSARTERKRVTLLAADGDALARQIGDALGYDIELLRWADGDAMTPALTDEECGELARAVVEVAGRRVLLIPDGGGLRVMSHD